MEKGTFDDFLRELKQKNDLVSIASKYVQLERKGRYYWCRCPFHGEKTPSLCINDMDSFYYCYGCHTAGDVITFVMNIETLSYIEAVKTLAEWANMEVPNSFSGRGGEDIEKAKRRKDRLVALMKETAKHYYNNLSLESAAPAHEYMKKRQLVGGLAVRFGIGYSSGFNDLPNYLSSLGYTEEEMLTAGVVKKKNDKIYDPLAGRLIFPIIDIYGNVIAFGGRTLEAKPEFAKYLNTADTPLFNKRFTLYAINILKKQRQQGPIPYVIVVEGYMDTISLHKAGFTMAIASMGTALTQEQAKMIKRFSDKVYICYDGDAPGQAATIRGLDILKENGLDVKVVQLPDGFDPDDVIKAYGREGYQKILDEALPLIEFKVKYLQTKFDMNSVDGRAKYLNSAIEVLSSVSDTVERELYIPMVSDISKTNADFIRQQLAKKLDGKEVKDEILNGLSGQKTPLKSTQKSTEIQANNDTTSSQNNSSSSEDKIISKEIGDDSLLDEILTEKSEKKLSPVVIKAEKYVLYSLVHSKPYVNFKTDISYLFSGTRTSYFRKIVELKKEFFDGELIQKFYESFTDNLKPEIVNIINYGAESAESEENEKKYYFDCLKTIYKNYLDEKLKNLSNMYTAEIDNLRRKEISDEMRIIMDKIKKCNVEEL